MIRYLPFGKMGRFGPFLFTLLIAACSDSDPRPAAPAVSDDPAVITVETEAPDSSAAPEAIAERVENPLPETAASPAEPAEASIEEMTAAPVEVVEEAEEAAAEEARTAAAEARHAAELAAEEAATAARQEAARLASDAETAAKAAAAEAEAKAVETAEAAAEEARLGAAEAAAAADAARAEAEAQAAALAAEAAAQPADGVVSSGTWLKKKRNSKGTWSIVRKEGALFVELDAAFSTRNAPDLKLFLSPLSAAAVGNKTALDGALLISLLDSNKGAQSYSIPDGTDLSAYKSIIIHCQDYTVLWSAADL